jgi:hypothetical protein
MTARIVSAVNGALMKDADCAGVQCVQIQAFLKREKE